MFFSSSVANHYSNSLSADFPFFRSSHFILFREHKIIHSNFSRDSVAYLKQVIQHGQGILLHGQLQNLLKNFAEILAIAFASC
jgi:hypothetical protein